MLEGGGGLKGEGRLQKICVVDGVLHCAVARAIEYGAMNDEDCAAHASG